MKTPIAYYGGKQGMVRHILPLIPDHHIYCEPFVGGGAVFWAKPQKVKIEILNDLDDRLINFYRVGKLQPDELIRLLDATLHSEADYRRSKEVLKDPNASDLDRAWAYFVRTQQSFGKGIDRGWGRNICRSSGQEWFNRLGRLQETLSRLSDVVISSCDAIKCIKHFDSENTFFYLDPPYLGTDCKGYKGNYLKEDYLSLIETLKTLKGKFLLSNYEQKDISMPEEWKLTTVEGRRNLRPEIKSPKAKKVEYLWRNYDINI